MKKILLFVFLFSATFMGKGQNLVPNGDFEQYSGCPDDLDQIDSALFWFSASIGTPDYYNQCAAFTVDVPVNLAGFQFAHSGMAYAGILTFWGLAMDTREYIEVPLATTLTAYLCYQFQMYVSCANNFQLSSNELSVYFSDSLITTNSWSPLPDTPQINNNLGFISDTLNWITYSANYTATGNENYLIIGNFNNDLNTGTLLINGSAIYNDAYVYIDDVSLISCTGIEENPNSKDQFLIYPNPVKDELKINSKSRIEEIKIFDAMGRIVLEQNDLSSGIINLKSFSKGIYFIEIRDGKNVTRKKFIKE